MVTPNIIEWQSIVMDWRYTAGRKRPAVVRMMKIFTWNLLTCNYSSRLLSSKSKLETYLLSTAHVFDTITRSYGRLSRRCRPVNNTRKAGLRNRWQWISLHVSEFYSWFKFFVLSTCEVVWQSILLPHLCIIYYLKSFLVSFSRKQREIVEIPFHEIAEQ